MKEEERIAQIFSVQKKSNIPKVSKETLRTFHSYLSKNLSFPFGAKYRKESFPSDEISDVKITDLLGIDKYEVEVVYGLICEGRVGRRKIQAPLAMITVSQEGKNEQLVKDYRTWFANYR
ncbi:hypothetical protein AKJ40_03220 [candidate division MSBL1 archaeon SCGC-AAA259M10]|uniref:Uncharacterized protein n=1 Tax=candidate division MSBL1 archaeon SCGC-AAA259M10 TaxID=1698270 RepID=A0A133UYZ7_9EURY|nr:hypothetical protein AKJ40_03220 [candidate division MSBL1 archaeon SCGC-AAA259M10]